MKKKRYEHAVVRDVLVSDYDGTEVTACMREMESDGWEFCGAVQTAARLPRGAPLSREPPMLTFYVFKRPV